MEIKKITGYHELTIGRWVATQKAARQGNAPLDGYLALVDAIYGVHSEDLPIAVVSQLIRSLDWLNVPYAPKAVKPYYDIDGIRYTPRLNVAKWPTAQYIDYVSVGEDADHIDRRLAIVLLPEGEKYSNTTIEARAKVFREHLTIDVAMDIARFFFQQFEALQMATLIYLAAEIKRNARRATGATKIQMLRQLVTLRSLRLLLQNGVGLPWSIE